MLKDPTEKNNFNLLRLLAALQVLFVHALNHFEFEGPLVSALKITPGVPVFFFISGLLISSAYERTRPNGIQKFFKNRFLRIFPALWFCVAVATVLLVTTNYLKTQSFSLSNFLFWLFSQVSIFQFYNPEFMRGFGVGVFNGALWTISVELQFYLLTPFLYFLLRKHVSLYMVIFGCSLALNVYFRFYIEWSNLLIKLAYVSFLPWLYMFMAGFVINKYREKVAKILAPIHLAWVMLAFICSMVLIGPYSANASNAINPISFLFLSACILKLSTARLFVPERLAGFIRSNDLSYGLYLYHMPFLNLLLYMNWLSGYRNVLATLILSAAAASISWYYIEKPALRFKRMI